MIGTQIGHYTIEEKIGEGGMGVVYRAHDTRLLRDVAIKILPSHLVSDEGSRKRFIHEAQTASSLNHPNICTVHDIGEENGVHFIVMEIVEGQTLREVLEDRGALPEPEVVDIAIKVCDALIAAHEKDIVHRDIKPDNIMVSRQGYVKVMDFGLAKLATDSAGTMFKMENDEIEKLDRDSPGNETGPSLFSATVSGLMGTVSYMSPEQAAGEPIDHKSDIFSLGVVLYELLTGTSPFQAKSNVTTLSKVISEQPEQISKITKAISPHMSNIVEGMLQKDPGQRYQNLQEPVGILKDLKEEYDSQGRFSWVWLLGMKFLPRKYRTIAITITLLISAMGVYMTVSIFSPPATVEATPYPFLLKFGSLGTGDGQFNRPHGITRDLSGNIIVADKMNHRIQVFDESGRFLYKFGSFGAEDGQFNQPTEVAVNSAGEILITDTFNHRVQAFDATGNFLFKFGSKCTVEIDPTCVDPDGIGPLESGDGQFDRPYGIALDKSDNMIISDHFNHRIQVFDSDGNFLFKFGGPCYQSMNNLHCVDPDGSGPLELGDGQFSNSTGVAVNSLGNIIALDHRNFRVQVFDSSGRFLYKYGSFGSEDGKFNQPVGVLIDNEDNIIVIDTGNNRIQVFESTGNYVFQFGSHGSGDGDLDNPVNAVVDEYGNMVVSDANNNRIQVFGRPIFTNVISQVGIKSLPGGSRFGIFDFDNDNNLDLYIQMTDVPSILYRNNGENKRYSFTNTSSSAGLDKVSGAHSGASLVDYDNDGFVDIFVTAHGAKILYRNKGDGTFEDVSDVSGVSGITNADRATHDAFGDYNNDGYLDLFLSNDTSRAGVLYKNTGPPQWQFTEVTAESNIFFKGWGHGIVFVDYDNDGDQDIYISTYYGNNFLYKNNGNGTFTEVALLLGLAIGDRSRGTVFGDYDNDGDLDLYVTRGVFHTAYSNFLFRNDGPPDWTFTDVTLEAGVGDTGDGGNSAFGDFDNDGDLDIIVANFNNQANVLYRNNGNGTFTNVTKLAGVSNPLNIDLIAFGDYNNDGFLDLYALIGEDNILFQNRATSNHWLKIKMVGTKSNRDGFGSRIIVSTGDLKQMRYVDGGDLGGGFQSSQPIHFGLGTADSVDRIEVKWPSGIVTILTDVAANQMLTIVEGDSAATQVPIQSL